MLISSSASYKYYAKIQISERKKQFGMFDLLVYSKVLFLWKYSADWYPWFQWLIAFLLSSVVSADDMA